MNSTNTMCMCIDMRATMPYCLCFFTLNLPRTGAWYHVPVAGSWEDNVRIVQGLIRDHNGILWGIVKHIWESYVGIV